MYSEDGYVCRVHSDTVCCGVFFRHLSEAKTQLAMLKDMLRQQQAVQQQMESAAVDSRCESSASVPVTDQPAGGTGLQKSLHRCDHLYCNKKEAISKPRLHHAGSRTWGPCGLYG